MTAPLGLRTWVPLLLVAYLSGLGLPLRDLRASLGQQLLTRALREERTPRDHDDWDHGVNLALAVRARVELVRAGLAPVGSRDEGAMVERAWSAAQLALGYEAASLRAGGASDLEPAVRGWGTRKPLSLGGGRSVTRAIDAYSTGTALGALADLAWLLNERRDRRGRQLTAQLEPIVVHWLEVRRFAAPGGPAFDKVALPLPEVRQRVVHNTDALFGRALLSLSHAARLEDDALRADRNRQLACALARQLRQNLLVRVLPADGRVHLADWTYELIKRGEAFQPNRPEDANHASYLLDFLAAAASDRVEEAWLNRQLVAKLGATLSQLIVRRPDGAAALELFVDPAQVSDDARGKKRAASFAFAADPAHPQRVVSWWRELAGDSRTLDLGLSIRTSWGWTRAVQAQPQLLDLIGRSLLASDRPDLPLNLFLAQAVFWRESAGVVARAH